MRDCAFEVVEAYATDAERTPTLDTARRLTRLLSNLDSNMAGTCRAPDAAGDSGVVVKFKCALLALESQMQRFVTAADVQAHRGRVHGRDA